MMILVIQADNTLSDERTEYLINDWLSFMRFLALACFTFSAFRDTFSIQGIGSSELMSRRLRTLTAALIGTCCLVLLSRDITLIRGYGTQQCRFRLGETAACGGARAASDPLTDGSNSINDPSRDQSTSAPADLGRTGGEPSPSVHRTLDGRGKLRDFLVQVPAGYDGVKPLALTFVFHGGNGRAADAAGLGIQDAPGAADASIFVFPEGTAFENYGVGWDDTCGGYDVVFFDRMLADIEARYRVDKTRVFLAGFSWGCDFATALACCRGDRIRGVAAAACSDEFRDKADYRTYANLACPVANKAAIRFTHDADGDSAYPAPYFASTSKLFRSMNACSSTAAQAPPGSCVSYPGCANPTIECVKPGIGHSPGPHWGTDTWAFFSSLK